MKKAIVVVLMAVILATPCFAQEVETDGFFSIEGTRWGTCGISASIELLGVNFGIGCSRTSYGFYEGRVYSCNTPQACFAEDASSYTDTPLVSIAYIRQPFPRDVSLFIMQPSGFGVYTRFNGLAGEDGFGMGIMFKVEDDWITTNPYAGIFGSVSPEEGEQESILIDVTITGVNTFFQDDPPVNITFIPSDGLTVSNISVISNTEIEFDLEIAADAPTGLKTIVVVYDDGDESIVGNNVFVVLENTF